MKTAHRRQSRAKRALRHADLPEFFYPGPPPDDRDKVDAPEPPKPTPPKKERQRS